MFILNFKSYSSRAGKILELLGEETWSGTLMAGTETSLGTNAEVDAETGWEAEISGGLSVGVSKFISSSLAESDYNSSTGAGSSSSIAGAVFASGTKNESRDDAGVVIRTLGRIGAESITEDESELFGTGAESESESGLTVTC